MISKALFAFERSLDHLKKNPQLLFVLSLFIIMPMLFLYTGQQFLNASRETQDRLYKDRVGLMHDVFASLMIVSRFEPDSLQKEINRIASQNSDIVVFRIAKLVGPEIIPIAALDETVIGVPEATLELYRSTLIRTDESLIFEAYTPEGRAWLAYRNVMSDTGDTYFIYTQISLEVIDAAIAHSRKSAFYSLGLVFLFVLGLVIWHISLTDYRYLYVKMQRANEMKDLFNNMIAHELRAPLTAIRGYAGLATESTNDPDLQKYALRIQQSAERLLILVNDLLDVARIQSGKLTFETVSYDISEVVLSVVDELQVSAVQKKIELTQTGTNESHIAMGDKKRLHQAITNLVSNAIKYTREGVIELDVTENYDSVEVRVKDTGMGISAADQKKLFAPFFRVQNDDVSQITGTGLGMWITKQLVELMGARVGVESIKGVGTHIVLTIPKKIGKKR